MPICASCRRNKPDFLFRLVKQSYFEAAVPAEVCIICETAPKKKCGKCMKALWPGDYFKQSSKLFYCKKCHEQTRRVERMMVTIRLEYRINRIIKILNKMPTHSIEHLRGALFQTIDGLKDGSITTDVAVQIVDVAKAIIDSARVENEFMQLTGSQGSGFIPVENKPLQIKN